jgi:hypothetical protein
VERSRPFSGSPLAGLPLLRDATSRRASSWDRSGGNDDRLHIQPGEEAVLAEIAGSGVIRHIWVTIASDEPDVLRKVVLRAWWDGEGSPSVAVPIGDFFGVGHAQTRNYSALPLQMSPEDGKGFKDSAVIPGGPRALAAELKLGGIASAPRYIQKPAFACRVFTEQRTFGESRWPFTLARPEAVDYSREGSPERSSSWITCSCFPGTNVTRRSTSSSSAPRFATPRRD